MTLTPLSPSPITASVRRRYLTGTGHASPTATVSAAFGWQNPEHRIPDHCADRIQGGQIEASGHVVILAVYLRVTDLLTVDVEQPYPVGAAFDD
jgi:hypothetical protein